MRKSASLFIVGLSLLIVSAPAQAAGTVKLGALFDDQRPYMSANTVEAKNAYTNYRRLFDQYMQSLTFTTFAGVNAQADYAGTTGGPAFNFSRSDALMDHIVGSKALATWSGKQVRGHNLIWNSFLPCWMNAEMTAAHPASQNCKTWLKKHKAGSYKWTAESLKNWMRNYIQTVMNRYPQVTEWDVVNEPLGADGKVRPGLWKQVLGDGYISLALQYAHQANPSAKLFINDYGIENYATDRVKIEAYYKLIGDLKREGVAVDGLGFQAHLHLGKTPNLKQWQDALTRIGSLGVATNLNELDINLYDAAQAARKKPSALFYEQGLAYRTAALACKTVPTCERITTWGIADHPEKSWREALYNLPLGSTAALPFDYAKGQFSIKPAWTGLLSGIA